MFESLKNKVMKNNTTCILSLMGGMALGSALTIFLAHKSGHVKSGDVHKRIVEEIDSLKECLKKHIESVKCNCDTNSASANTEIAQE